MEFAAERKRGYDARPCWRRVNCVIGLSRAMTMHTHAPINNATSSTSRGVHAMNRDVRPLTVQCVGMDTGLYIRAWCGHCLY